MANEKKWEIYEGLKKMAREVNSGIVNAKGEQKHFGRRLEALLKKNDSMYAEVIRDLKETVDHAKAVEDELTERQKNIFKKIEKIEMELGIPHYTERSWDYFL